MKKIIVSFAFIALVLGVNSALAGGCCSALLVQNDFSFTVSSIGDVGETIYYNCDSLQDFAKAMLEQMGAKNVTVDCAGAGSSMSQPVMDPLVTVHFQSPRLPGADVHGAPITAQWQDVTLKGDSNCHLAEQVLQGVSSHFELKLPTGSLFNCSDMNDQYSVAASALFAL